MGASKCCGSHGHGEGDVGNGDDDGDGDGGILSEQYPAHNKVRESNSGGTLVQKKHRHDDRAGVPF